MEKRVRANHKAKREEGSDHCNKSRGTNITAKMSNVQENKER
jgi:hypothetical protein